MIGNEDQAVYSERIPALGISLEQGTDDVPDDDRYHIVLDGAVVASFSNEKRALTEYRIRRDLLIEERGYSSGFEPLPPEEVLRRERVDSELLSLRAAASQAKQANATRKGGKGRG